MRIRILPEASHDIQCGIDFYESQRQGLGHRFSDSTLAGIDSLSVYAGIHEKYRGAHRMLLKSFPFAVYYVVHTSVVEVLAVLDCRQDPSTIVDRLG